MTLISDMNERARIREAIPLETGRILIEVLDLIAKETPTPALLKEVVSLLADWTGFEAVGLRIKEGNDYPYYQTRGMSTEFIRLENSLCPRGHSQDLEIHGDNDVPLECACGAVIQGKIDRSKPFFTDYGSLWSSSNTRLLDEFPELREGIRGNCVQAGYESSALIPLRLGGNTFGLIQFEDRRPELLSPELVFTLESVAVSLALALSQRQYIQELTKEKELLETRVQERSRELSHSNELLRREIGKKEKAEEETRKSEARFRVLFDQSPDGVMVVDMERMQIVLGNEEICRMLGYPPEDLPGLKLENVHPETSLPRLMAEFDSLVQGEKHFVQAMPVLRKDGNVFLADISANSFEMGGRKCALGVFRDITQRQLAEKKLENALTKYLILFDSFPLGIAVSDPEGNIVEVNREAERLLGFSERELLTRAISGAEWEMTHLDGTAMPPDEFAGVRALREGQLISHEEMGIVTSPGEIAWVSVTAAPIPLPDYGVVVTYGDIGSRRHAEEAFRESEGHFRAFVTASSDAVYRMNPDWTEMRILQGREFIPDTTSPSSNWLDNYIHQDDQQQVLSAIGEAIRNKSVFELEHRVKRSDGTLGWIFSRAVPLRDAKGEILEWIGAAKDITVRKQAEEAMQRLEAAIEQAAEVIVITDPEGNIEYVNPAFERLTGYSREQALGQNPRILKSGEQDEDFYGDLWQTISNGTTWRGRIVNKRKDGTLFTEDATISPVRDHAGRIVNYVAAKRDISEEIRLQDQLFQAQKMESVGRLAGGVAHDFNNMLGVILGHAEIALGSTNPEDSIHLDLQEIRKAGRRSADLTRQLLAFARRQTISPKVLDLNDVVSNMLKMLQRLIGEDIELGWFPGHELWMVKIDPSQVDQLLANLAVNCRDAITGVGRVTIETENVTLADSTATARRGIAPGDYVLLAVSDDGAGISHEVIDHIFEPFFTTKEIGKGTGLGLATVYGIVTQNHGFIDVYSEPGQGSTFKIYLPGCITEPVTQKTEDLWRTLPVGSETVLIVEDEEAFLNLGKKILEKQGYKLLTAASPVHAISLAEDYPDEIHIVISDVVMPQMNGKELAERLLALNPELKCLFMSGYTADAIARHGVLEEGVNFIQKPFSVAAFATKVREVLDS